MKSPKIEFKHLAAAVVVALLLVLNLLGTFSGQSHAVTVLAPEYKVVTFSQFATPAQVQTLLNNQGKMGWELVLGAASVNQITFVTTPYFVFVKK